MAGGVRHRLGMMKKMMALVLASTISFGGCAIHSSGGGGAVDRQLAHRDYVLVVGHNPPVGCPELVRMHPDGTSEFRFYMPDAQDAVEPDGYQYTEAKPGEVLSFSETDFFSKLMSADYAHQKAILRVYNLDKHP